MQNLDCRLGWGAGSLPFLGPNKDRVNEENQYDKWWFGWWAHAG